MAKKGGKKKGKGFTPFQAPSRPPPGTYDPSLDAAERAAGRGYGDLQQDLERAQGYAYTDVFDPRIGSIAQLGRDRDDTLQDLGLSKDRSLFDLTRGFTRGTE